MAGRPSSPAEHESAETAKATGAAAYRTTSRKLQAEVVLLSLALAHSCRLPRLAHWPRPRFCRRWLPTGPRALARLERQAAGPTRPPSGRRFGQVPRRRCLSSVCFGRGPRGFCLGSFCVARPRFCRGVWPQGWETPGTSLENAGRSPAGARLLLVVLFARGLAGRLRDRAPSVLGRFFIARLRARPTLVHPMGVWAALLRREAASPQWATKWRSCPALLAPPTAGAGPHHVLAQRGVQGRLVESLGALEGAGLAATGPQGAQLLPERAPPSALTEGGGRGPTTPPASRARRSRPQTSAAPAAYPFPNLLFPYLVGGKGLSWTS